MCSLHLQKNKEKERKGLETKKNAIKIKNILSMIKSLYLSRKPLRDLREDSLVCLKILSARLKREKIDKGGFILGNRTTAAD